VPMKVLAALPVGEVGTDPPVNEGVPIVKIAQLCKLL
jgi:hypothetical protein